MAVRTEFSFDVGQNEHHSVSVRWSSAVWGDLRVIVDNEEVLHKRIFFESPKIHRHELTVGISEVHSVVIERGSFHAGSPFQVLVDGAPVDVEE